MVDYQSIRLVLSEKLDFHPYIRIQPPKWISQARLIKSIINDNVVKAGVLQTFMYGFRVGLAYLVMLSVMSFNIGIIIAAIAGYSLGFLVFDRRIFWGSMIVYDGPPDLPPLICR
ncbi:hypothetical protein F8388_005564 [Cannabis sativa]|uniref:Copper transport protein n=1 Tax=Cannabis sativa TaxID=3483 RepID=A0A7J6GYC9_CANSA|nr:hypothetical protein G4B88_024294 [Cannabis sativa]KAF4387947.1 hypothetical protein F8388_005564 [Cannabis sativa]